MTIRVQGDATARPRSSAVRVAFAIGAALAFTILAALGTWQLYRLQWKLTLIERVEQRVHAEPVPAPGPERWSEITAATDEYRRVRVTGRFLPGLTARVLAATELGSGYWLLTPMRTEAGHIILINRGFIPVNSAFRDGDAGSGPVTVTGLMRMSEPGGGFLRKNDSAADRWYSRDVPALARARGLDRVAPYFIDAQATPGSAGSMTAGQPVAGLTVVAFHNNHLVYAITWYALALMVLGASWWVAREERRKRRPGTDDQQGDRQHDRDRGQ